MKMMIKTILLLCFYFVADTSVKAQGCDPWTGPAGTTECVLLEGHYDELHDRYAYGYDDYQWATCLSNAYIQLKSHGKSICSSHLDVPVTYCWSQCQAERFDLYSGTVNDECRCDPEGEAQTLSPIPDNGYATLPEWCLSPSGTECTWYRKCLEKRHPCEASGHGYALSYAQKFCNLYTKRSTYFTGQGLEWVNAVRKCLQVALVPHICPWSKATCEELKKFAFDSHTPCYLEPFQGKPSICDLGCWDWAQIFWTIKSGYTQAFVESLQGTIDVILGCGKKFNLLGTSCPTVIVQLALVRSVLKVGKRSTDQELILNDLAGSIADELAIKLKWDKQVMDWYAYAPKTLTI